jgi:dTDP-L-rhamnose 4-epimerase
VTKRVLITGGAGFIGSHLCDELIEHSYEVRVLDMLSAQVHEQSKHPPAYLNLAIEFINASTIDEGAVSKALDGVDAVVHLAALVGVGQSMYEIGNYVYFNTYGAGALLDVLGHHRIVKLIVASSMSIYGEGATDPTGLPIPTDEHKQPALSSVYALTKYDQERLSLLWGRAYNVPTIALRFFNVYGSRQSLCNPYTGVLAIFASRLLNNQPPIIFEDGLQSRDFVHVSDIVRGIRLALESDVRDEVINLGSGTRLTVLQVAELLASALGKDILPEITGKTRVGDIRHCFADISKARELLGYEPRIMPEDGIREYAQWLQTQVAEDRLAEHVRELEEKGLLK